jgi:hypothetical protein
MLTFKTPDDMTDEVALAISHEKFVERFTHRNITLTAEDANLLRVYILMTTNTRREEAEAWAKLAEERNEDGTPAFPNAQSNADWWERTCARIEDIGRAIDASPFIEQPEK